MADLSGFSSDALITAMMALTHQIHAEAQKGRSTTELREQRDAARRELLRRTSDIVVPPGLDPDASANPVPHHVRISSICKNCEQVIEATPVLDKNLRVCSSFQWFHADTGEEACK